MNTHQAYLEWIDQKILEHQTEIARLTVARSVLEDMPGLRLQGKVEREKKRQHHPTRAESKGVRMEILGVLQKTMPPVGGKPIEILNALGVGTGKADRRPYYNALSRMEKDGAVIRSADGLYALPYPTQKEPVPAHQSGTNPT